MKKLAKNNLLLVVVSFIGLLTLFTPFKLASYVALILLIAAVVPLSKRIGYITRTVIIFLLVTCLQQIIALLFWKISWNYTFLWSLLPFYIALLVYVFINRKNTAIDVSCRKSELVSLLVSVISVGVIAFGTFQGGTKPQQALRYITRGFDNSTHLSLIMSVYDNQGYLYGSVDQVGEKLVFTSLTAYPEGWHLTNSLLWHGFSDTLNFNYSGKLMILYVITALFWYLLALFLIVELILLIAGKTIGKKLTYIEYAGATALAVIIQLTFLLGILRFGFVNYIGIIAYIVAQAFIAYSIYSKSRLLHAPVLILLCALLAAGTAFSWLLIAPVAYMVVFFITLDTVKLRLIDGVQSLRSVFSRIDLINFAIFTSTLLFLGAGVVQGILQIKYSVIPNNINADTGIWTTNHLLLGLLLLCSLIIIAGHGRSRTLERFIAIEIFSIGIVAGAIYLFQYYSAAKISYYSEKTNALLGIMLLICVGGVMLRALRALRIRHGGVFCLAGTAGVLIMLPVVFGIDTSEVRFALGNDRKLSAYTASQLNTLIENKQASQNNVVVMKNLDYEEDVITTHLIDVLSRKQTVCSRNVANYQMMGSDAQDKLTESIINCAKENSATKFYIISSTSNYTDLVSTFSAYGNIEIILSS